LVEFFDMLFELGLTAFDGGRFQATCQTPTSLLVIDLRVWLQVMLQQRLGSWVDVGRLPMG